MQRIGGGETPAPTAPRSGPGMAERAGLLPLAGIFKTRQQPASTGERGFQRVAGRKLPSAFSAGATGPSGPSRRPVPMPAAFEHNNSNDNGISAPHTRNASIARDSTGYYGAGGIARQDSDESSNPAETLRPGPARQATVHPGGPYLLSPTASSPPASPRANLLQGRAATPVNAPGSPTYGPPRGRFTEEV